MSTITINSRTSGDTITASFFNDLRSALGGDFIGRDSSGIAASGQNLGTVALPWGTIWASGLVLGGTSVDTSSITSPANRIISGKKRTSSDQLMFIKPNGAAASFLLEGATTNLRVDINGSTVTVTTDITKSSLTLGPAATNTATINDAVASSQDDTRTWGEAHNYRELTISSAGASVTSKVGSYCAFKIGSEYFLGYLESATRINRCLRGYFYDSSYAPINRSTFTNGATITIMSLGWVFVENNATTIDVSYTNPTWSQAQPSAPASGDYWFDIGNQTWKRYDGAAFQIINRTLIGLVVIDSTNCVAARSFDAYSSFSSENSIEMAYKSVTTVKSNNPYSVVSVAGRKVMLGATLTEWDISANLASSGDMYNATEQATTEYYFYVGYDGTKRVSDISPHFRGDLQGWYHPHQLWRCVGAIKNDGSSNFDETTITSYGLDAILREEVVLREEQSNGTNGGSSVSGSFATRTLNTTYRGAGVRWAALASNQILLAPGVYDIKAMSPLSNSGGTKVRLQNMTDSSTTIVGKSYNSNGGASVIDAQFQGRITVAYPKVYELQYRTGSSQATTGLGIAVSFTEVEVYSSVAIRKIK